VWKRERGIRAILCCEQVQYLGAPLDRPEMKRFLVLPLPPSSYSIARNGSGNERRCKNLLTRPQLVLCVTIAQFTLSRKGNILGHGYLSQVLNDYDSYYDGTAREKLL
jgi:hypothetical protein